MHKHKCHACPGTTTTCAHATCTASAPPPLSRISGRSMLTTVVMVSMLMPRLSTSLQMHTLNSPNITSHHELPDKPTHNKQTKRNEKKRNSRISKLWLAMIHSEGEKKT